MTSIAAKRAGLQRSGLHRRGLHRTGLHRTGLHRTGLHRVVALMTFAFLALSVTPADPLSLLGSTAALVVVLIAVRVSTVAAMSGVSSGVGRRARAHRQSLESTPEPQHPQTAGRPRTRAPARSLAAA